MPGGLGVGPLVRVQLLSDRAHPLELAVEGPVRIRSLPDLAVLHEGVLPRQVTIELAGGALTVDGAPFEGPTRFEPLETRRFSVRSLAAGGEEELRSFRGVLDILPHAGGLRLVNELTVEEYLAGVVGKEMAERRFTLDALKAQAVAARTFTLFHLSAGGPLKPSESFPASTRFQAYGGMAFETEGAVEAVRATAGWVLTYDARLFQSYYHSSCGGATAAGAIFHEEDIAPLRGVPCEYCAGAPGSEWEVEMPLWRIERAVRDWAVERGVDMGRLVDLKPVAEAEGRPRYVSVVHDKGSFELRAERFRALLDLKSAVFEASIRRNGDNQTVARFRGRGFGHGVGLCQNGACTLAAGREYREILAYYFPESGLMRVY